MGLVKWIWSLSSECFAFEINQRKTPAPTNHSNGFQQFLVTGIPILQPTTNLGTQRRCLSDTSQGIYQNVERTIPGVQNHLFGPLSSHLYIAPFTQFSNSLILYFFKPVSFTFKTKSVLKYNRGIILLIQMMRTH